ncbi:unnamed protein product [Protopolystoma xenopodis]|uniref:Uncharacterized protein n=1 Tax=Protopolystoma xenopodis TaxID=117903 RepID=A0A448X7E1_9PLAT|nr:unnamed protein product [Protopolystoma xenopodis]
MIFNVSPMNLTPLPMLDGSFFHKEILTHRSAQLPSTSRAKIPLFTSIMLMLSLHLTCTSIPN